MASVLVAAIMAASLLLLYLTSLRQPRLLDWSLSGLCFLATNLIGAIAAKYQLGHVLVPAAGNAFYLAGHACILVGVFRLG